MIGQLEILIPVHEAQFLKNLKLRLTQNRNINIVSFVDGPDLDSKMVQ